MFFLLRKNGFNSFWASEVIPTMVLDRASHSDFGGKPILTLVPQNTMSEFWLPLNSFDYTKNSKCGCGELSKKSWLTNQKVFHILVYYWLIKWCVIDYGLFNFFKPCWPCSLPVELAIWYSLPWVPLRLSWKCRSSGVQISKSPSPSQYPIVQCWNRRWFFEGAYHDGSCLYYLCIGNLVATRIMIKMCDTQLLPRNCVPSRLSDNPRNWAKRTSNHVAWTKCCNLMLWCVAASHTLARHRTIICMHWDSWMAKAK